MNEQNNYFYEFGPFRLDVQKRLLTRAGEIVALKPKAFDTLLALIRADGQVVGKDALMSQVWPDTAVEEGNLTFNISTLRKALGDDPRRHEYIVTIPGEGYQFVAGVRARFDELVVHESTSITIEEDEEEPFIDAELPTQLALRGASGSLSGTRLAVLALVSLLLLAVIAVGILWIINRRQAKEILTKVDRPSPSPIVRITTSGKAKHAAISPDGLYIAQTFTDAKGDSLYLTRIGAPQNVLIAGPSKAEFVAITFAPDGDAVYYLALDRDKGHTALQRVPVLGGASTVVVEDVGPIGFSPDKQQITYVRSDGVATRIFIANSDGSNERAVASLNQPQFFRVYWNAPAWSPDGKTIACQARLSDEQGSFETVVGVNVADGSLTPLTPARWDLVDQPVWLADGKGLLVTASEDESSPNQVWYLDLHSRKASRFTADLNSYSDLSITKDGAKIVAIQDLNTSSIWTSSSGDPAQEIFSEVGLIDDVIWTTDNKILYRSSASGSSEIWLMDADGANQKQITVDAKVSRGMSVSPDGRYVFFSSERNGHFNIWRVESDGRNITQVTSGVEEVYPQVTPDSQWVVYQRGELEPRLWRIPFAGGTPMQLTDTRASRPAISIKGDLIAYHYLDPASSQWRIGIMSSQGGPRLKQFDLPSVTPNSRLVRWSPDGRVAFPDGARGSAEIWLQSLEGGSQQRLTDLKAEIISSFDWSRDGKTLVVARTVTTSDTVLMNNSLRLK